MRILILSPHTDDCEVGCGGSIARWTEEGHDVHVLCFSAAVVSLPPGFGPGTTNEEFYKSMQVFGLFDKAVLTNYPTREFPAWAQQIRQKLVDKKDRFEPDLVVGPSSTDCHQDHAVVHEEMVRVFKRDASIICYEAPWNQTLTHTQHFVRLTRAHMAKKHEAMQHYQSQIFKGSGYFDPEHTMGLARVRGVQCNADYAEAFEVIRWMK